MESSPPEQYEEPPRKKRGVAGVIVFAIALIVAIMLIASPWFWALVGDLSGTERTYDESARLTVRRTIEFSVSGMGAVNYVLDVPLPKSLTDSASEYVQEMTKTDPTPTPLDEFKYGQHWMVWEGNDVSSKEIVIDYEFEVKTVVWNIASGDSADVGDIPQSVKDQYLGEEWKIDPTLPEVVSLSEQLTGLDDNVRDKLRSIYDYMSDNLAYETGRDGVPKDCQQTLDDGTGDCDDQSILFCSLARAAGIPAWMEFGALYDPGQKIWGGHAWAKAYVPLADGGGDAVCVDVVNKEFFVRACNRFADWESDGEGAHMEDYYTTLSYSSIHTVQLEYSESYEGSYEAIGGKINMVIDRSFWHGTLAEVGASMILIPGKPSNHSDL